jgi:hypothetical protein
VKINFDFNNFFSVNLVIALALVGSTFTQFRFPGLPIGVSDVFFISYLVYSVGLFSISVNYHSSFKLMDPTRSLIIPLFIFFVFYVILTFAGTIYSNFLITNGSLAFPTNPDAASLILSPYHNLMAFTYLLVIYFILFIRADIKIGLVAFYTVILLSFLTAIFYIASRYSNNFFGINLYYLSTDRLMLFTKSPNHLGDFIAPLPFLLLYFVKNSKSIIFTSLLLFLTISTLLAGFDSLSKSTIVGILSGFAYLFLNYIFRGKYGLHFIICAVIFLMGVILFLQNFYSDAINDALKKVLDSNASLVFPKTLIYDIYVRQGLFFNAIEVGNISPFFGLGAGASSGIIEPFLGRESHNNLSEMIMTSGYLGFAAYFLLMLYTFVRISVTKQPLIMSAFIVITVTTMLHMQLRQPLFWFYILFLLYFSSSVNNEEPKNTK